MSDHSMAICRALPIPTLLTCIMAGGLLAGCSSNLKVSEIQKDVTSVTFIQIGKEPHAYEFGVVDGASFWGSGDTAAIPSAGAMGISESAHYAATSAATLAKDVSEDVFAQKEKQLKVKFRNLVDGSKLTSEITHQVMPVIAQAWDINYDPGKLGIYHVDGWEINEDGSFSLLDPDTDLVVTFGIDRVRLNEKPSVGGFFSTLATLGFNDKPVAPELYGRAIVFKRDPKSNSLMKVWETSCLVNALMMSDAEKFSVLIESPSLAKPLFEEASAKFIQSCTYMIRGSSGT